MEAAEAETTQGDEPRHRGGFGIYKYGRGYWVRVVTATAFGVLFLSMAGWAWQQLEALRLPTPRWSYATGVAQGTLVTGDQVTLLRLVDNKAQPIGKAVVESYRTAGSNEGVLIVHKIEMEGDASEQEAKRIEKAGLDGGQPAFSSSVGGAIGIPIFQRVYLQAGVATGIALLGAMLIYRYVGNRPGPVEFLIATDEEMKKVNWSTRRIIIDSTYVVIGATMLIALFIFLFDLIMNRSLYRWIVG